MEEIDFSGYSDLRGSRLQGRKSPQAGLRTGEQELEAELAKETGLLQSHNKT